jgi:hypothetical protein
MRFALATGLFLLAAVSIIWTQNGPTVASKYFSLGDTIQWRYVHERFFPGVSQLASFEHTYSLRIESVEGDTAIGTLVVVGDVEPWVRLTLDGEMRTEGLVTSEERSEYHAQYRVKINSFTGQLTSVSTDDVSIQWRYQDSVMGRRRPDSVLMKHQVRSIQGIWNQLVAQPLQDIQPDSVGAELHYTFTRGEQSASVDHQRVVMDYDSPLPLLYWFESDHFGMPNTRRCWIERVHMTSGSTMKPDTP